MSESKRDTLRVERLTMVDLGGEVEVRHDTGGSMLLLPEEQRALAAWLDPEAERGLTAARLGVGALELLLEEEQAQIRALRSDLAEARALTWQASKHLETDRAEARRERDQALADLARVEAERASLAAALRYERSAADPEWDATDGAHPAWWRGHHHGASSMALALESARAEVQRLKADRDAATRRHRGEVQRLKAALAVARLDADEAEQEAADLRGRLGRMPWEDDEEREHAPSVAAALDAAADDPTEGGRWRVLTAGDVLPEGYQWRLRGRTEWSAGVRVGARITPADSMEREHRAPATAPADDDEPSVADGFEVTL